MRAAVTYMNTRYFIWALAGLTTFLNIVGLDVLNFWMLGLTIIFAALFSDDALPMTAPAVFAPFAVSRRYVPYNFKTSEMYRMPSVYVPLLILAGLCAAAIIFRFIVRAEWRRIFVRRHLTVGFAALWATFLLNGMFSGEYTIKNMLIGLMLFFCMIVLYYYFAGTVRRSRDAVPYLASVLFALGVNISVQMLGLYLSRPIEELTAGNKDLIRLGWGISNRIGSMLLMTLPSGFYLAARSRYCTPYIFLSGGMMLALVFTYSRASLLFAVPVALLCFGYVCVKGRDRASACVLAAGLVAAVVIASSMNFDDIKHLFTYYINSGFDDHGRFDLWREALEKYLRAPVFGYGYAYKYDTVFANVYSPHNTLLQYLCISGIFGLVCYLYHRLETAVLFFRGITRERFFLGLSIAAILAFGLIDVSMKTEIILLIMGVVYAVAEHDYDRAAVIRPLF